MCLRLWHLRPKPWCWVYPEDSSAGGCPCSAVENPAWGPLVCPHQGSAQVCGAMEVGVGVRSSHTCRKPLEGGERRDPWLL